jgi:hypothetical protein
MPHSYLHVERIIVLPPHQRFCTAFTNNVDLSGNLVFCAFPSYFVNKMLTG